MVVFYIFWRSDGFITVTDPDGNLIQVAASSLQGAGGANMATNSGIICDIVKKLFQSILLEIY